MKIFTKVMTGAAFALLSLGSAHAATVSCPDPIGGATGFNRQVVVTGALAGGTCFFKEGNFQGDNLSGGLGSSYFLLDKDIAPDGQGEGSLRYTLTTDSSGTWTLSTNLWSNFQELFLAFHFGNGSGNPDSFIVELDPNVLTGTWALIPTAVANGLSNIYLAGRGPINCPPGGCPGEEVPEPGSLALLGMGLAGLALIRRRKRA